MKENKEKDYLFTFTFLFKLFFLFKKQSFLKRKENEKEKQLEKEPTLLVSVSRCSTWNKFHFWKKKGK